MACLKVILGVRIADACGRVERETPLRACFGKGVWLKCSLSHLFLPFLFPRGVWLCVLRRVENSGIGIYAIRKVIFSSLEFIFIYFLGNASADF